MTPQRRSELIVRLPNLTRPRADRLAASLAPLARRLGGSISRIDRDHHPDHAMHIGREKIV